VDIMPQVGMIADGRGGVCRSADTTPAMRSVQGQDKNR
jgi:hypothetical protein